MVPWPQDDYREEEILVIPSMKLQSARYCDRKEGLLSKYTVTSNSKPQHVNNFNMTCNCTASVRKYNRGSKIRTGVGNSKLSNPTEALKRHCSRSLKFKHYNTI